MSMRPQCAAMYLDLRPTCKAHIVEIVFFKFQLTSLVDMASIEASHRLSVVLAAAVTLLPVLLCTLLALAVAHQRRKRRAPLPPGPRSLPVLGNLTSMAAAGGGHLRLEQQLAALSARHGPLMFLRLGARNTLVVNSPAMAHAVLREQDALFSDRSPPSYALAEVIGPIDLFSPLSSTWKAHKGVGTAEVFATRRVRELQPRRSAGVAEVLATVRDLTAAAAREGLPAPPAVQFRSLAHGLFLNLFSDIAQGRRWCAMPPPGASCDVVTAAWRDWTASYQRLIGDGLLLAAEPVVADTFPGLAFLDALVNRGLQARLDSYKQTVRDTFERIIDDRRRHLQQQQHNPAADTCTHTQLSMCDSLLLGKHSDDGQPAPHDFTLRMLHGFMMSGGSASAFLELAMAELLAHPQYLIQLQDEMDRAVGRARLVNDDDLARPNLPLLHAVLLECMRLHPPSPLTLPHCNSQRDAVVAGYHVPRGTTVLVNIYGIGTNPEVWPDPHAFKPERFLARPDLDNTGRHLEIPTFSAGRRMCPAAHFMNRTLAFVLARLVQCFRWELAPAFQVDFTPTGGVIGFLQKPLQVVPSLRVPPHIYDVPAWT